jgi:hypothetical protein
LDEVSHSCGSESSKETSGSLCGYDLSASLEKGMASKVRVDLDTRFDDIDCCKRNMTHTVTSGM